MTARVLLMLGFKLEAENFINGIPESCNCSFEEAMRALARAYDMRNAGTGVLSVAEPRSIRMLQMPVADTEQWDDGSDSGSEAPENDIDYGTFADEEAYTYY